MGQSYDVTFSLKVKDRKKLIDALNAYIDETTEDGSVIWSLEDLDRTSMTDLMKAVITDRGFMEEGDEYSSCFDASYGWEGVMIDAFEGMAPYLLDGSYLEIYPDAGRDYFEVKDGKMEAIQ